MGVGEYVALAAVVLPALADIFAGMTKNEKLPYRSKILTFAQKIKFIGNVAKKLNER